MVIRIEDLEERNRQPLTALFIRNGLEFSDDEPVPTDMLAGWQAMDGDRLVGGCVLSLRQGGYIIDGIAVEPDHRHGDTGTRLLEKALDLVRTRGGGPVYLVARAPGFFARNGFWTIRREEAPVFFECFTCSQFNKTCFPEVMRIDVE